MKNNLVFDFATQWAKEDRAKAEIARAEGRLVDADFYDRNADHYAALAVSTLLDEAR